MYHQGYALKVFLKDHYSVTEVSKLLGVSRQAVYPLYGDEALDPVIVEKFVKAGWQIPGITMPADADNISNVVNEPGAEYRAAGNKAAIEKELAVKDEMIKLQKEAIDKLDEHLRVALENHRRAVAEFNQTLQLALKK
jgi:hypothetical protein